MTGLPREGLRPGASSPALSSLEELPVRYARGVGPARAQLLERLGVRTVAELLNRLPRRLEDRSHLRPIAQLAGGTTDTVQGMVSRVTQFRPRRRRDLVLVKAAVTDGTGVLQAVWYNQPYLARQLPVGGRVILHGRVVRRGGEVQMVSPEFEVVEDGEDAETLHAGRIVPVYGSTEGLSQRTLRGIVARALDDHAGSVEEWMPAEILAHYGFPSLGEALREAHFPQSLPSWETARNRLVFEELLLFQLLVLRQRAAWTAETRAVPYGDAGPLLARFLGSLPYRLTAAQRRVLGEILRDLDGPHPMNRLLQGDVGSGKTVVAAAALLRAVGGGAQGALMAPTEILAEQHYLTLRRLREPPPGGAPGGAGAGKRRPRRRGRGDARPHRGGRCLPPPGPRGGGRAAPLRRGPAGGAAPQGGAPRRPGDDGHADPAHPGPHSLRRPRRLGPGRAPPRAVADPDGPPGRAPPPQGVRVRAGAGGPGEAGLHRLPPHRGVRQAPGRGRDGAGLPPPGGSPPRAPRGGGARPPPGGGAGPRHGGPPRRRDRRARGHDRHRGRHRRAERHGDGHRGRRPLRAGPAPPAPGPRGTRGPPVLLHPRGRPADRGGAGAPAGHGGDDGRVPDRPARPGAAGRGRAPGRAAPARHQRLPGGRPPAGPPVGRAGAGGGPPHRGAGSRPRASRAPGPGPGAPGPVRGGSGRERPGGLTTWGRPSPREGGRPGRLGGPAGSAPRPAASGRRWGTPSPLGSPGRRCWTSSRGRAGSGWRPYDAGPGTWCSWSATLDGSGRSGASSRGRGSGSGRRSGAGTSLPRSPRSAPRGGGSTSSSWTLPTARGSSRGASGSSRRPASSPPGA